jgi:hypothetical protein
MKIIKRKTHAVMDYIMGIVLIASPWILGFADHGSARLSAMAVGILMLIMSLCTNYEGGIIRIIPMGTHLMMDVLAGIFLVLSPWLLDFRDQVYIPHLILGLLEIGAALCTRKDPEPAPGTTRNRQTAFTDGNIRYR